MKTMKYFLMGVMLMGIGTTAMAQDGTAADVDALKALIQSKPADMKKQVNNFYKKNKKNAENLVAFGRAFYEAKDTANARVFAKYALAATKNSCAPAYVLLGDISALSDDGGAAAQNYEQAIYADPKTPEAYRKYAAVYRKIDPAGAVAKLEELRKQLPDYPVDALIGHINYISGPSRYADAIEAFDKVPLSQMTKMDFIEKASAGYFTGKHADALKTAVAGLAKFPENATLNRLAMFCNTETEQFQEALKYADVLFNKIQRDSASLSYMDYVYFGNALNGAQQHDAAIEQYENALKMEFDNKDKKAGVVKTLSDAYKGKKDFDNAIKYYRQYMEDVSQTSANDYVGLATLYRQSTGVKDEAGQIEALNQCDQVYAEMIEKFPASEDFGTLQRANLKAALDPTMEQGLAKPFFEHLIDIINARPEKDATDQKRLVTSYQYMMSYYSINKDAAKALDFAKKIYELQPDNQGIKETIDALSKVVK